ncbi:MAG: hypothetical protein A3G33_03420 [Omnitrophica bacterium RIFCSPLOWO2_12_FULL_44_17]|uniref:Prepilin-type N-terminal cleavage/methylation domain-containing protein n=1 Tax=Candidatus Danuiimicrobium aquiferis TaxID=1801832 RepID=A0A1G1KTY5_9BACT|nr:MAG: hypothetical protein A3B72_06965 [Omnitrophica bacterium RIFCSPHIGHO2_02_FULL_45_28]OGW96367.1 MAG: hypothetical protein A3G33_03420 [Omnitrophica bacterium RIFCSPLOWO2_12_FULL_44_17]OGX04824.1 MAG: hypothetical protein A3J12_07710 [Omnitrophica bacterium RIFCSPLOWO2_02_FULL_44_11]
MELIHREKNNESRKCEVKPARVIRSFHLMRGFTLLELIIAMIFVSIIVLGSSALQFSVVQQANKVGLEMRVRQRMDFVFRHMELMLANATNVSVTYSPAVESPTGFNTSTLCFTYAIDGINYCYKYWYNYADTYGSTSNSIRLDSPTRWITILYSTGGSTPDQKAQTRIVPGPGTRGFELSPDKKIVYVSLKGQIAMGKVNKLITMPSSYRYIDMPPIRKSIYMPMSS